MRVQKNKWFHNRAMLVEVFIIANLAFLALDVFIAHSVNAFAHWGEWIPFWFSLVAAVLLLLIFGRSLTKREADVLAHLRQGMGQWTGLVVGFISIVIGITGMLFHMGSQFFSLMTIKSLVYTAPFVAPLAFSGLGFLLILNRMVNAQLLEWGKWILFLTMSGFVGNFTLSLCDHAQNGFFYSREWIPVFTSAAAVGFLITAILRPVDRVFLVICLAIMVINSGVGVLGFYYHLSSNLHGISSNLKDNFLYGSPVFAPLLFPNLALLGVIGIWDVMVK